MTTSELFLYLLRCELNGMKPEPGSIPAETMAALYELSQKQSLVALTAYALEDAGISDPGFTEARYHAIYRNAHLLEAGNEVCAFLEKSGIRHMPLKGMCLQELYPKPGMRQMSDCDILYDACAEETVHDWFLSSGYTPKKKKTIVHSSYTKPPVIKIEMHYKLLHDSAGWLMNLDTIWSRASVCEGCRARYAFSPLDEFVYISAHACKHFLQHGTGIRSLIDLYLYRRARLPGLDSKVIGQRLDEVKIRFPVEQLMQLAEAVFAPENEKRELSGEERILLERMLGNGTYGTNDRFVQNQLERIQKKGEKSRIAAKLGYCMERLRLNDLVLFAYPFFGRHPLLRPLLVIYRILRALFRPTKKLKQELRYLWHWK